MTLTREILEESTEIRPKTSNDKPPAKTSAKYSNVDSLENALAFQVLGSQTLVADEDGKIVGAVAFSIEDRKDLVGVPDREKVEPGKIIYIAHIGSIAPGVGRLLMQAVFDQAKDRKLDVWLSATPSACGFYQKLGMTKIGAFFKLVQD
jgi:ribosomal protein S18 acetylase RimI-like enzyme